MAKSAADGQRISPAASHVVLWLICVAVVFLLHFPYLRLPFFWDEAGYYFPAALDLAQHGHLIPQNTVANPHPPLLFLYLAAFIKVFGIAPAVTRSAMCIVAGTALYSVLLVATLMVSAEAGLWATGLLALSPLFYAQSTMALLDVAATAGTLFALYFYLRGRVAGYLIAATALCLTRETGAALVVLLAAVAWRASNWQRRMLMLTPLLPLAGWFAFLHASTGHWLGDPTFVSYNLWTTLNPLRFLATLARRLHFLFFVDFRWTLAIPALRMLWTARRRPGQLLWLAVAMYLVVMSILGGAVLNRYLLPALALFYLLAVEALERLGVPNRKWGLLILLLAQIGCFFWNPPYPFPFEENLAYSDFVNLHETAVDRVHTLAPGTRVLTTWPATDELRRPELGYTQSPAMVVAIEDFSEQSFAKIGREDFDAILMFSNEWQPEFDLLRQWPVLERIRENLYHRRPQMKPEWVRAKYHLASLGSIHLRGQWVEWLQRIEYYRRAPAAGQSHVDLKLFDCQHHGVTGLAPCGDSQNGEAPSWKARWHDRVHLIDSRESWRRGSEADRGIDSADADRRR